MRSIPNGDGHHDVTSEMSLTASVPEVAVLQPFTLFPEILIAGQSRGLAGPCGPGVVGAPGSTDGVRRPSLTPHDGSRAFASTTPAADADAFAPSWGAAARPEPSHVARMPIDEGAPWPHR